MKNKKFLRLIVISLMLSLSICSCNKKINKDINNKQNQTLETKKDIELNDKKLIATDSIATKSMATKSSAAKVDVDLDKIINNQKKLKKFLIQLQLLQESNMKKMYDNFSFGLSYKEVSEYINKTNFRYIDDVTLKYLKDENLNTIDMQDRKGLVVFSKTEMNLNDEINNIKENKKETTKDSKEVDKNDIKKNEKETTNDSKEIDKNDIKENYIDITSNDNLFKSFIVLTFNKDNVLVGKFNNLLLDNNQTLDLNILNGSLTYDVSIPLEISKDSDIKTIYEKMDFVREEIEKNDKKIKEIQDENVKTITSIYEKLNLNLPKEEFLNIVKKDNLKIEKMNNIGLKNLNDKFSTNYKSGYYIYTSKDNEQISVDLRYNNIYISILFNDKDQLFYKNKVIYENIDEKGLNLKNPEDYNLKEVYDEIDKNNETLNNFNTQKQSFYKYLDQNLIYFNKNINYDLNYKDILNELNKSELDYIDNFNNLTILEAKDKDGNNISINKENYNNCIKVTSYLRDIYLFFKDDSLIGINRSDYFDISEVTMNNYKNLNTIKKGLNQLIEEENNIKQKKQIYENVIDYKLKNIINSFDYDMNNNKQKLSKKSDVILALNNSGFKYEEGMNKADGLYFIGIYKNPKDTKFTYKIYFNESEKIELIQSN